MASRRVICTIPLGAIALFSTLQPIVAQQETSAALSGIVTDLSGDPVIATDITIEHVPTANYSRAKTNTAGLFAFSGLAVGGPYALTFAAEGFEPKRLYGITLGLGETRTIEMMLIKYDDRVLNLDKFEVLAQRESVGPGARTSLAREEIETVPTIETSLNEFAAEDPRVVQLDPESDELSAAGQNSRFNSLTVDGVKLNDLFGVPLNGFPSQGNPLSLESVEAISVETSPYDAQRGGFTGASINAVTRSGSNQFRGSLYYSYRNQNFRAKHPVTGKRDPFVDETWGVTLGGPVLRDRLFFFSSYEHSERTEPAPSAGFTPTEEALNRILEIAAGYGYDPGALTNPGKQNKRDNKYLAKLDWRINARHRVSARFSQTRGRQPSFVDYTTFGRVSLSGHWYDSEQNLDAWSAQAFSQWSSVFHTEVKVAAQRYDSGRLIRSRFPQVRIGGVPGDNGGTGSVYIGTDESSQQNALSVDNRQASATATWLVGKHRIQLGAEVESSDFTNTFLQNAFGNYSFASINAFATGRPSSFTYQYPLPGRSPTVTWGYSINSFFLQDTWKPLRRLTLVGGVRLDYPDAHSKPQFNPLVQQTFGRRNDATIDGAYTVAPRASFTLRLDKKGYTRLRGGAGVFQGRAPGVWLSNAYSNDGFSSAVNTRVDGFTPDPDNQPQGPPSARRERVDLLDENFHFPCVARANLAFDQRLPWQDVTVSAEVLQSWAIEGIAFKNINLRRTGTGPDGRPIYGDRTTSRAFIPNSQYRSAEFTDVYLLTNTSKGEARQITLSLKRPLRGWWGGSLAFTRSRSEEVSPVTASTAHTNFSTRASIDPNGDELGTANYEIRDRLQARVTVRFELVRRFETKLTLRYEGRSGRPYSFIYSTDLNGDSATYDNDLLYVPAGRDDPRVRFSNVTEADAFFAYVDRTPALKRFAGQIVPRNSERSRYQHRYDLRIVQKIPLWARLKGVLFFDVLNVANLLNDEWGRVYAVSFPYGLAVASATYDPVANQYVYRFTGVRDQALQPTLSRWRMQGGVRLTF